VDSFNLRTMMYTLYNTVDSFKTVTRSTHELRCIHHAIQ